MDKNDEITIEAIMNGYLITRSYRKAIVSDKPFDYTYVSEYYSFTNWDDVSKYISDNKLETPPAHI